MLLDNVQDIVFSGDAGISVDPAFNLMVFLVREWDTEAFDCSSTLTKMYLYVAEVLVRDRTRRLSLLDFIGEAGGKLDSDLVIVAKL